MASVRPAKAPISMLSPERGGDLWRKNLSAVMSDSIPIVDILRTLSVAEEPVLAVTQWQGQPGPSTHTRGRTTEEMKTYAEWTGSGTDLAQFLSIGDAVDETMVNYFIEVLPPATMSADLVQIGEPYSHV